ncbi:hypothetical protein XENTR_v10002689 [Xenopus tropicalis]|nr:hypothetical protein XENTR_v10002689 [Xenopus tropicalis]
MWQHFNCLNIFTAERNCRHNALGMFPRLQSVCKLDILLLPPTSCKHAQLKEFCLNGRLSVKKTALLIYSFLIEIHMTGFLMANLDPGYSLSKCKMLKDVCLPLF